MQTLRNYEKGKGGGYITIEGSHKTALPFDGSEKAAHALCPHPLSHPCCPIFLLNRLLRQIGTTQNAQHHLHAECHSSQSPLPGRQLACKDSCTRGQL